MSYKLVKVIFNLDKSRDVEDIAKNLSEKEARKRALLKNEGEGFEIDKPVIAYMAVPMEQKAA